MKQSILNHEVLVLNKIWIGLNITDVRTALGLIYKDYARIILTEDIYDKFNNLVGIKLSSLDYEQLITLSERLSEDKYHLIHSSKYKHLVPSVISHKTEELPSYYVKYSRQSICCRDNFLCQYCGEKVSKDNFTLDHVVPRSRGGEINLEQYFCMLWKKQFV